MTLEQLNSLLLSMKASTKDYPFGEGVAVYRICRKMFALIDENHPDRRLNLKCDPEEADALRTNYQGIIPGYHMNKLHWNSILQNSDISEELLIYMIKNSYNLVVKSLTKKERENLQKE